MKRISPTYWLAILCLGACVSFAGEKGSGKSDANKTKTAQALSESESYTPQTGSYIKNNVRRSGRITDGSSQLLVIDRDAIERSGAFTLRQVLTRSGAGR